MSDSKQSEKAYLRRIGAGTWDLLKPFSPPGANTLDASTHLIQDFAVAIRHLRPSPTDLILDLGAGACWCSDWLQRLNLRTVAVDISHDMLRLGRSRLPHPDRAWLVTGDFEHLPFATGSFEKAYCLSAIHHVPDIARALGEIHRVLKPQGAVLFSEPGAGHADKPASVAAMRDFGVLEQDIIVSKFMADCRRAGFAEVRLKPMSYVIPEFDLTNEQWDAWGRLARRRRPARAAQKLWRALLEMAGLGKRHLLFEEAFAMSLVRLLKGVIGSHPVIVAAKAPLAHTHATLHYARISVVSAPATARPDIAVTMVVRVTNGGTVEWQAEPRGDRAHVRLGVQLLDAEGRLVNRDFHRESFAGPVAPGQQADVSVSCPAPPAAGVYHFKVDLVLEGVTWFEPMGSETAIHRIEIARASAPSG